MCSEMQPVEGTIDVAIVGTPTLSHAQCLFEKGLACVPRYGLLRAHTSFNRRSLKERVYGSHLCETIYSCSLTFCMCAHDLMVRYDRYVLLCMIVWSVSVDHTLYIEGRLLVDVGLLKAHTSC